MDINDEDDSELVALSHGLQRRIDSAFNKALESAGLVAPSPRKKRKLAHHSFEPAAGGFVLEDAGGFIIDDGASAGGFLPSEDEVAVSTEELASHIPLSLVPVALQTLDLPPDDDEVMDVFRKAASGWSGGGGSRQDGEDSPMVSRKDFRAVCAVLLDTGGDEDVSEAASGGGDAAPSEGVDNDASMDGGGFVYESDLTEGEPSDDEYVEGTPVRGKGKGKTGGTPSRGQRRSRQAASATSSDHDEDDDGRPRPLTTRQQCDARAAFALFFPDAPDDQLDQQRLAIRDIAQAAKMLGEKLTAEDILEMLDVYSTSRDKSMNLADFERMMVDTRLT